MKCYRKRSLLDIIREKNPTNFLLILLAAVRNSTRLPVSLNTSDDKRRGSKNYCANIEEINIEAMSVL